MPVNDKLERKRSAESGHELSRASAPRPRGAEDRVLREVLRRHVIIRGVHERSPRRDETHGRTSQYDGKRDRGTGTKSGRGVHLGCCEGVGGEISGGVHTATGEGSAQNITGIGVFTLG